METNIQLKRRIGNKRVGQQYSKTLWESQDRPQEFTWTVTAAKEIPVVEAGQA